MSSAKHLSPPSPPPSRPTQASKSNSDSLKANIAKERYTSSPDTLKMKQKARTVAIPGLPTNLAYPLKIKANGPGKPKSSSSKKKPSPSRKKGSPLDSIDKLDITGMYGQGSFHHDGPFDACRPHRNKRTSRAPVAAFPVNGPNNTLDGVDYRRGNQNTENRIMGRADNEAFEEFSLGVPQKEQQEVQQAQPLIRDNSGGFDPTMKSNPVHGNTTMGLGTSTFLEGAPAPKPVKTDQAEEDQQPLQQQNQIKRKKSIMQRLRGNSNSNGSVAEKVQEKRAAVTADPLPPIPPTPVQLPSERDIDPPPQQPISPSPARGNSFLRRVKSLKMVTNRGRRTVTDPIM